MFSSTLAVENPWSGKKGTGYFLLFCESGSVSCARFLAVPFEPRQVSSSRGSYDCGTQGPSI